MSTDVPESVTRRGVQEILRTFAASRWTAMRLEVGGMTITVGKHGPPAAAPSPAPAGVRGTVEAAPATAPEPPPLARSAAPSSLRSAAPAPPAAPALDTTGLTPVTSPAVGAFWTAPAPGQPPFVAVGQRVADGEQLAIVEVMKLMNPVLSPVAGEIVAVAAANAELVEFEQPLFWIRADGR